VNDKNIKFHKLNKNLFFVKHTARDVDYKIDNFIDKNKDEISNDILLAINTCKNQIVKIYYNYIQEGELRSSDL